ncbi:MAG: hypothetical protein ACJAS4_000307 [Bacteriovoracaceae bacterium]|jgi:hypothetical protein
MKTKGLGKLVILGLILTSLVSCKEEEFYEKEFIDTLSDQYERENLPDDVAENPFESPSTNPGDNDSVPPVDVGTNPVPPVVVVPPVEPPVVVVPPVEPPVVVVPPVEPPVVVVPPVEPPVVVVPPVEPPVVVVPPVEPPVVVVPPVEPPVVVVPPVEPPVVVVPPVEPPVVVVPPVEPPVVLEDITDSFNQNENGTKLDILWVIDDSGSMADEQQALGANFEAFIKEFVNKGIDFQMAVTTTDTSRGRAGKVYKDSMERLTSDKLKEDKNQFMEDFANLVKVGTRGSGYEKGIQASEVFSDRFSNSWMRKDAYFTIVYMSDEEDQSSKSVPDHLKQIQKWKDNNGLIKAFSIVDMVKTRKSGGISRGYERYNEITTLTGGKVASIKSDFHSTLLEMGEQIADLTEQFPLSKKPYDSANIEIYVDGVLDSAWSYDSSSNSVKFDAYSIPAAGAKIEIRYNSVK